jgi:hypothetical protein
MNEAFAPRMYPLTSTDRKLLLGLQGHLCAICGTDGQLVIDHDHDTGLVRGGLCHTCNAGLGMFRDSQSFLMAAMGYLAKAQLIKDSISPKELKRMRMDRRIESV